MRFRTLRWQQILPRLVVLIVAVWGVQYLLGFAAQRMAVRFGEAVLEAKVDVGTAHVSLVDRQVRLDNIRLSNPRCPSNQLLEADACELNIAVVPLLRKQTVVDRGRVTGLRFTAATTGETSNDSGDTRAAKSLWLASNADDLAREWISHVGGQFNAPSVNEFESVRQAEALCARWPAQCAVLNERASKLKCRADDLQQSADSAEANRLRHDGFFSTLPEKIESLEQDFDTFGGEIEKYASSLEAERRGIVAARQRDEKQVRKQLEFAPIDANSLSAYMLREQIAGPLDDLIGWLRWTRQAVPANATESDAQKRGEDVLFAGCTPAPNFIIRALHLEGAASLGARAFPVYGRLMDLSDSPSRHSDPIRLRLTSTDSQQLELQVTIDRTGTAARDELLADFRGVALPEMQLGRPDELALKLEKSVGTLSISLAIEDEKLSGELQLVQKQIGMSPVLQGELSDVPLAAPLETTLGKVNSVATRVSLQGTLDEPSCTLWSNLGPALAEAMDRAVQSAGNERSEQLLAEARRQVDERLAHLERQLAEERVKLGSQLANAARHLETIAQRQESRERISGEQLGRRLPTDSLIR
jgi:uncharacterized protein (TIGR03545 family)